MILGKRLMSVLLVVVMLMTVMPMNVIVNAKTTLKAGDVIEFGSYPKNEVTDSSYSGETIVYKDKIYSVEPIKWRVLQVAAGKALLLSSEIIDGKRYNSTSATVDGYYGNNYAHSDVREWLIGDFFNSAFSTYEKNAIIATTLDNSAASTSINASGSYTQYSSEATTDKVFLLSKKEAETYAKNYYSTTATDYAGANGFRPIVHSASEISYNWLTRTAGNNTFQIFYVHTRFGSYTVYFNWNDDAITGTMGVRPAVYIDIEAYDDYIANQDQYDKEQEFIDEHITFLNSSSYSSVSSNSFYKNVWVSEEENELRNIISGSVWEYLGDVDELMSIKFDDFTINANPYELIFFDLINNYNTIDTYADIGLTKYFSEFNKIYESIMKLFKSTDEWNKDISDSVKNALAIDIKKFLSTDNYQFSSSDAYESFCKFLTNSKNNKKIDDIFTGLNLASDVSDYVSSTGDIAEIFKDICNAYATALAFKETDEIFKKILVYCDHEMFASFDIFGGSFSEVLLDYFSVQSDSDAFEYALNENLASVVTISFDVIAQSFLKNSSILTLSKKFNIDAGKASQLIMAYSYTYNFLELVTKTGEKSEIYRLLATAAHFEKYLNEYNKFAGELLLKSSSLVDAIDFDVSWRMLQIVNSFAYENLAKYVRLSEKSVFGKYVKKDNGDIIKAITIDMLIPGMQLTIFDFIEKDDAYYTDSETFAVNKALTWKNTFCHLKNYDTRKFLSVKCPTEVFIYRNDELMLSITEEKIVCNDENIAFAVIGSEKYISLPCNDEYEIKITATDNGKMIYSVQEIYEGETVRLVSYDDIELIKDKSYKGNIPTEIYASSELYNLVADSGKLETPDVNIYNENDLFIENSVQKEPTETADGFINFTINGNDYTIILHNWNEETVIAPTCTTDGKTALKCSVCGETKYYNIINSLGHEFESETIAATCTENGYIVKICHCGEQVFEEISAKGHIDNNLDNYCDACNEMIKNISTCSHICHSDNWFFKIIWTLYNFLMRIFSMERYCPCGAAHY